MLGRMLTVDPEATFRSGRDVTSYKPAWWLPGPHATTLWGKLGRHEPALDVAWERLDTPDGDFLELAHLGPNASNERDAAAAHGDHVDRPHLLIMHGLEGGVEANYVRGFAREASARGWRATLMLFRTCGPTPNLRPRSYHSGETGDLRLVIDTLAARRPGTPLGVAAVSLGGNVLCKLLGEDGPPLPLELQAAVAISTPFDLARASRYIGRGFGKVYELAFLRSLVPKARAKIARHPELASVDASEPIRTIWEFDDRFTSPVHGFRDAADYYARSSSLQFLDGIRVPTLLLNAVDDPFLPPAVLDEVRRVAARNGALTIEFPDHGGHVGFTAARGAFTPFYYGEWRAVDFIAQQIAHGQSQSVTSANKDVTTSTEVVGAS
jgi:predicted alpha/beta-fold hydrolase